MTEFTSPILQQAVSNVLKHVEKSEKIRKEKDVADRLAYERKLKIDADATISYLEKSIDERSKEGFTDAEYSFGVPVSRSSHYDMITHQTICGIVRKHFEKLGFTVSDLSYRKNSGAGFGQMEDEPYEYTGVRVNWLWQYKKAYGK